jgi:dTDP-glucose pyrophosphorylase
MLILIFFTDSIYNVSNIDSYCLSLSEQLNCEKDTIKTTFIETNFNAFLIKDENYSLFLNKYLNDKPEDPRFKSIKDKILGFNRDEEINEFDSIYFKQTAILIKIEINEITLWLLNIKNEDFQNIFISINHFGLQIKRFINSIKFKDINIKFVEEKTPLDTAGCLSFFKNKIDKNLIVINADVMTDLKLEKILNYHLDSKSDLTIGCLIHQYQIPFGVISLKKNKYNTIEEKPIIKKLVNCGIYVLSKNVITLTKKNERLSMLGLIERAKSKKKKIALFPMHENWIDVGNKVNLQKARDWLTEK